MSNQRGSLLIFSYVFAAFLAVWLSTAFVRGTTESRVSDRYSDTSQAFQLAEAAVDRALAQLRTGSTASIATTSFSNGTYSATVTPNLTPIGTYTILGTGVQDGIQQQIEVVVQRTVSAPYQWGFFGIEKVNVNGSIVTDSYNSSVGSYAATRRTNGDIGTNGTAAASIHLVGSAMINGDLFVGPGGDPSTAIRIQGGRVITGTPQAATQTFGFSSPTPPVECTSDPRVNSNETLTLAEGTYHYESLTVEAGAQIVTTGDVTVYVDGGVDFRGHALTGANSVPSALTIKVLGTENVDLSGAATLHAVIEAPNANVRITGGATVYGAIVGKTVRITGSAVVHYDEALSSTQSSDSQLSIRSWRTL